MISLKLFFFSAFYKVSDTRAKKFKGEFWILFEIMQVSIPHTYQKKLNVSKKLKEEFAWF